MNAAELELRAMCNILAKAETDADRREVARYLLDRHLLIIDFLMHILDPPKTKNSYVFSCLFNKYY